MQPTSCPIFNHPALLLLEKCKTLHALKQVHGWMITSGLILHTFPLSRILLTSSAIASSYSLSIFTRIPNPSIFLFNTLISSLSNHKRNAHLALSLYSQLISHKALRPNSFTFPSLFKACGSHPWLAHGRALHTHVLKFLQPSYDHFIQASLLNFYSKCGKVNISRYFFNQISKPDLATWNSILAAYARNGNASCFGNVDSEDVDLSLEVLLLFGEMQNSLVRPSEVTLVSLISACSDLGALSQGAWAHAYVIKKKLVLNHFLGTALIELYSKCGCLDLARQLFELLTQRDTLCYNAMIGAFAIHGYGHRALDLFKKMRLEGLFVDDVTLIVTMCACSHVGLVEEGCELFESMKGIYGIEPKLEHYGCLVDLLGRAGQLEEAERRIQTMPIKANAILWRSLLGAARVHRNLEIGEVALKNLIQLEPETSGNYVLLSNIYAITDKWDDVTRVRKLMKDRKINKMPGSSLIEIDGVMHEFLMGDKTHPHTEQIYMKLEEIGRRLKEYGHEPRTKEVFFDIAEEEKEDALLCHSERLAIAFAFIASHSGTTIRIIKNLRICSDCHASTKLISKIYERDIVVRDRNRFHHFQNGACSCLDYCRDASLVGTRDGD
ncbi:pentatricopeptide repeat-containing protein At5g43790 isoform X2 [Malania oleifera]|uniref:pentatricopeptide repeat-containing protein At5g43790 isoform X2 n=1 Tax=Malania oleifera TaxID=397392 RepID=UPI0025AE929F|nr:pentatricopeptide repeat-containing protein At5g43790 isoform X2 [Malania oleifera]